MKAYTNVFVHADDLAQVVLSEALGGKLRVSIGEELNLVLSPEVEDGLRDALLARASVRGRIEGSGTTEVGVEMSKSETVSHAPILLGSGGV